MPCHILCNTAGDIEMWDAQPFPGSTRVDYEVVRGWDGRPYKAGEEPPRPAKAIFEALRASRDMPFPPCRPLSGGRGLLLLFMESPA